MTTFTTPASLVMHAHTHIHCTPTLLSELGIMASVIQEPKRDPEALTVIGLLTTVRRPQPGMRMQKNVTFIYVSEVTVCVYVLWFGLSDVGC